MVQVIGLDTRERCAHGRLRESFWGFQEQDAQRGAVAKVVCCTTNSATNRSSSNSKVSCLSQFELIIGGAR